MRLSRFRPTSDQALELSTAAMIDVVFLLLIFFLVTTTFNTPERQLEPSIRERESAESTNANVGPAVVDVLRESSVAIYQFGQTKTSNLQTITELLQRWPDKSRGAIVRLADDAPFGMAAQAVNACRQAGFPKPVTIEPLR
ncbi:MAG: ExbD/TolR family protein [Pirellulaceae bacterium]